MKNKSKTKSIEPREKSQKSSLKGSRNNYRSPSCNRSNRSKCSKTSQHPHIPKLRNNKCLIKVVDEYQ